MNYYKRGLAEAAACTDRLGVIENYPLGFGDLFQITPMALGVIQNYPGALGVIKKTRPPKLIKT